MWDLGSLMATNPLPLPSNLDPLIGANGMDFVSETLSNEHPQIAIQKIQQRTCLTNSLCPPLLGLTDQLGICRAGD